MTMSRRKIAILLIVGASAASCGTTTTNQPEATSIAEPVVSPVVTAPSNPFADTSGQPVAAPTVEVRATDPYEAVSEAVALARSGDSGSALVALDRWSSDAEVGGWALYNVGAIHFFEGRVAEAATAWERALLADPANGAAMTALLRLRLREGRVSEARSLLRAQLTTSENAPSIRAAGLIVDLFEGRYEDVIREGGEILLLADDNLDVFYAVAEANLRLGSLELARYIVTQGTERDPERIDFYLLLSQIELEEGNRAGARTWLQRVIEREPNHLEALNNLGVLQLAARDYRGANESFERAVELDPDYRELWLNLGNARKGLQNYEGALEAFEHAREFDAQWADPWFNIGLLYLDAEFGTATRADRLQLAIDAFDAYIARAGRLAADAPVNTHRAEAVRLLEEERNLATDPFAGGGGDADPFGDGDDADPFAEDADPFGDDGADEGEESDPFGEDPFGEDPFGGE
jgi:tetratricopeptide (TPR) repeat protein